MATSTSSSEKMFIGVSSRLYTSPPGSDLPPTPPPLTAAQLAMDARLIAILDAPLAPGETAMFGYQRKEIQLVSALATLTIVEARALHLRLANSRASDALATKFMRLTVERRTRLLNFIADARRRAAMGGK